MPQIAAQLRLRRAFRYGYFLFLLFFPALLVLIGLVAFNGEVIDMMDRAVPVTPAMLLALAMGLSVPLFFAFWSLLGTAMLGVHANPPSLLEDIRD